MKQDIMVRLKNITKTYNLFESNMDRVKEIFHPLRKKYHRPFNAIEDVSLELQKGNALGIIGRNGSGKSTLLQIICGILRPNSGSIEINGKIAALLELGAGFSPEFTGRENVYLNGAILGFTRNEMNKLFDEIVDFSEIGDFLDQPVKTYSSGMYVRLAFAVQACVKPDVLIVDEALSVGDIFFQQKCHTRMQALLDGNTSIIFVSHDMSAIEKYTTEVILLDHGKCVFKGQPNEAVERYYALDRPKLRTSKAIPQHTSEDIKVRSDCASFVSDIIDDWPSEDAFLDLSKAVVIGEEDIARCTGVALCDEAGEPRCSFKIGETACFFYEFELLNDIDVPLGGIVITDKMNVNVHGKTSWQYLIKAPAITPKHSRIRFRQEMELLIAPGQYTFQIGLATINEEGYSRISKSNYNDYFPLMSTILRVRQVGQIIIEEKRKGNGVTYPFYGYADLNGNCMLSVIF